MGPKVDTARERQEKDRHEALESSGLPYHV